MERRKSSSSRKHSSTTKSYKNPSEDSRKKSNNPDPETSKIDYTSMFSLTDPAMVKRFQRGSYTSDADEGSSIEEINPIADNNEDQIFAEYEMSEKLLEPDSEIVLAHLRKSAREKRGVVLDESAEIETVQDKLEFASIESEHKKTKNEKKSNDNKKSKHANSFELLDNSEPSKDLKVAVDLMIESGPSSVASSIPSDFGKFRKRKEDKEELWKNYTVSQMINASFIVTVEPAKNLKDGPICRLIMTKDCNGQATEDSRVPMNFADYEFSSDSEPEEKGYYFRKLYRHNPNLKSTKTKIDELKEQVAPEKFIKRIRHAITYDTKDEIAKWRRPVRKPFPAFYYPVQFVVPRRNPLQKLPKREYNKIRGLRPRSSSVISFEQMEPAIRRTEKETKTRRRRSCSPSRPSPVHRLCHTMMTDFILPDDRLERFDMTLDPRRFKEGRFLEDVIVMWCDYYLKRIKRARRKGVKMTIPPLLKYTDYYPVWKLDEDCRNLVAPKRWPKCCAWQLDLIKAVSKILFPEEVHFTMKAEMMAYSGEVRRGAERLLNTFLQRELCTRNAMETIFALMLLKPKELQNVANFSKTLKEMTSCIFKKGRIPFGFFDYILPKKFTPRQPMAACNYCPDAILAAIELVPSIVNIFQQDNVDVTAKFERRRRSKIQKPPSEPEIADAVEDSANLVETEESSNPPTERSENLTKEGKSRKRGRKSLYGTKGKKQKVAGSDLEHLKEPVSDSGSVKISEINPEPSPKPLNTADIPVEKPKITSFSPELGVEDSSYTSMIVEVGDEVDMDAIEDIQDSEEKVHTPESPVQNAKSDILPENDMQLGDQYVQQKSAEIKMDSYSQCGNKESNVNIESKLTEESPATRSEKKIDNISIPSKESSKTHNKKNSETTEPIHKSRKCLKKKLSNTAEVDNEMDKTNSQVTPSVNRVVEVENITLPERSSATPVLPFSEFIVENDIQDILPEEILVIEEHLPSQTGVVDPDDQEPVSKKMKLISTAVVSDIRDELPSMATKDSEVTMSNGKKSSEVEREEGEIFDDDEEEIFVIEKNDSSTQCEKVKTSGLPKSSRTQNNYGKSKKKEIKDNFKLPFDLQENFFKDNKSKSDIQKAKGVSNKKGSQKTKKTSFIISDILSSTVQKSSNRCKEKHNNSEAISSTPTSSILMSDDVYVVNISESPPEPHDEVTIIETPAITGSYTLTCSNPSNSNTPVDEESTKSPEKKTNCEEAEVITTLYIDSQGNSRTSLSSQRKIDERFESKIITSKPDVFIIEIRPHPLPEPTAPNEDKPSEVETKIVENESSVNSESQISNETSHLEANEKKICSLVTSNSDLLLVLRESEDNDVLDYLTSLETGVTLETPSDIKPIPFSNVIGTPQCHSAKVTSVKYHHRLGNDDDYLSLQNYNLADVYEVNKEKVILYCRRIGEDIANCQGVKPHKSKYIFIWEYTSIGWVLTKRLHNTIELSLKDPLDTESGILYDYGTSVIFRRPENESYIVYKFSLGDYLGASGKLKSIEGYFTAYNGKMIILFPTEDTEKAKLDWLPCVSLINFSLGGQKINELIINSYSKVFGTQKPPIPLQIIDNLEKEKSLFIHRKEPDNNTATEEIPSNIGDDIISNGHKIIHKLQETIVTDSVVKYTEVFSEPAIAELQSETIPTYTIITTTASTDPEKDISAINQPYKELEALEGISVEKDNVVPDKSIIEDGETVAHPVNEFTEITVEDVPLSETPSRPPIRITLPLTSTPLMPRHIKLDGFNDESDEEFIPQPPKLQKRHRLSSGEDSIESTKEESPKASTSQTNEENRQELQSSTSKIDTIKSNSPQTSNKKKKKEIHQQRCYLFQHSSSDSDSPHSRSPTPNSSITYKSREGRSPSSTSGRKERGICITAFFRKS